MDDLTKKRCVPCEGGVPKLGPAELRELSRQTPGWETRRALDGFAGRRAEPGGPQQPSERLERSFTFADFRQAMAFVNRMAELAEAEGHHPDFAVHYAKVEVSLWTHAAGGLTENDFILAAKLSRLV